MAVPGDAASGLQPDEAEVHEPLLDALGGRSLAGHVGMLKEYLRMA